MQELAEGFRREQVYMHPDKSDDSHLLIFESSKRPVVAVCRESIFIWLPKALFRFHTSARKYCCRNDRNQLGVDTGLLRPA